MGAENTVFNCTPLDPFVRFSLLKHKGNAEFKANCAALCAAILQDLRTQTKEKLRKTNTEFRILTISLLMA